MFPRRRGSNWHPSIPWYKSTFWSNSVGNFRVKEKGRRGNHWKVEKEENLCPCSYKAQHMNWFHKIYKMCRWPRFVPHTQKKICSKKANVLFWFGQKTKWRFIFYTTNDTMSLGISWQRQKHWLLLYMCLFKAIWRNYILGALARTIQNVHSESQFIQLSHLTVFFKMT